MNNTKKEVKMNIAGALVLTVVVLGVYLFLVGSLVGYFNGINGLVID